MSGEPTAIRFPVFGRLLAHPRFVWVVVAVAVVLGLASLGNGLLADDFMHYAFLTAQHSGRSEAPWWDMFVLVEHDPKHTIGMRNSGRYPWWVDPDLHIAFFRPLSTATHHLDHLLWPNSPALMHAHSLAWHAAGCAMAWAVARRLVSDPRVAGLAALIFTLSFTHVVAWSWLAHRNGLVSTFWALACLLAHSRWRAEGKRASGFAAPVLLGAALLSAEAGVVTLALLLAYELFVANDGVRTRLLALGPGLLTVIAWRMLYNHLGYGALGSGGYLDPIGQPLAFLIALPERYSAFVAMSVSAPLIPIMPLSLWVISGVGVGLALLVFLISPGSKLGAARFGVAATALASVPLAASVPVDRLLILASFGVALACAELMDSWLLRRSPFAPALVAILAGWVALVQVVIPMPAAVYVASHLGQVTVPHSDVYGPELPDAGLNKKSLVVLHTPHYAAADRLAGNRIRRGLSAPNFVWLLHSGPTPPQVSCIDERTIELREPKAGWPVGGFAVQFRNTASKPFQVGDTVRTLDHVVSIVEVDDGRPIAVRFEFRTKREHESFVWTTWGADEFVALRPEQVCER